MNAHIGKNPNEIGYHIGDLPECEGIKVTVTPSLHAIRKVIERLRIFGMLESANELAMAIGDDPQS